MSGESLESLARRCAAFHRLGMLARGSEMLVEFVDALVEALAHDGARAGVLSAPIAELLAAQERGDPIGVADRLEFGVLPELVRGER